MTRPSDHPQELQPAARLSLLATTLGELQAHLAERGQPRYRAKQIMEWIYAKRVADFEAMTNLPKDLRAELARSACITQGQIDSEAVSVDGTRKVLLRWPDGATTETVWIPDGQRNTACLSTQVGCPVGCAFCASGSGGLERNLSAAEIVEQALHVARLIDRVAAEQGKPRLTNIVVMGIGEPLANYRSLLTALRILNAPWGLNVGARKITVSTIGLPKQIRQLAHENLQLNLALSLHAPNERLRAELIPWAAHIALKEVLAACRYYFEQTHREITLEYVLLRDVNMQAEHAEGLARIAKRLRANVNLLRYNPVPDLPFRRPSSEATYAFQKLLRRRGVNAHVRSSRGRDVSAACGQLRRAAAEPDE